MLFVSIIVSIRAVGAFFWPFYVYRSLIGWYCPGRPGHDVVTVPTVTVVTRAVGAFFLVVHMYTYSNVLGKLPRPAGSRCRYGTHRNGRDPGGRGFFFGRVPPYPVVSGTVARRNGTVARRNGGIRRVPPYHV